MYVQITYVGWGRRLISDVLDISDRINAGSYLATVEIEKTFDSLDYTFLLDVFKKICFGNNFTHWIKILLTNQEFCVVRGSSNTPYCKLQKNAPQGDPISAYLFITDSKIILAIIKNNPNIKGFNISNHN